MGYNYETQRQALFTDEGQRLFLQIRDTVKVLIGHAGAFQMVCAWKNAAGDTWTMTACVDRLVELGELTEVNPGKYMGQYRLFIKP